MLTNISIYFLFNKLKTLLYKVTPSLITLTALSLGVTSIKYSFDGQFNVSVLLIIIAAFLDGIDGKIARFLNATTTFGAQLDSLVDICNFGIAPGIIVYLWSLIEMPYQGIGWGVIIFYFICSSLRLARFNCQNSYDINNKNPGETFFKGLPMPAAALLLLTPMMLGFKLCCNTMPVFLYEYNILYIFIISCLTISPISFYSFKSLNIKRNKIHIFVFFLGLFFVSAIYEPWVVFPTISFLYLVVTLIINLYYFK